MCPVQSAPQADPGLPTHPVMGIGRGFPLQKKKKKKKVHPPQKKLSAEIRM